MRARTISQIAQSTMALAIATAIVACGQPVTEIPTSPSPTSPSALGIIGIEISGPPTRTTTPGQPVQFTAAVRLEDGTLKDGSSVPAILWQSSDPSVIQVTQTGLATPMVSAGDALISAEIKGNRFLRATRALIVLPPGTFRLTGTVSEEGFSSIPIPGARVEMLSGTPVSITNESGQFKLYGVPPVADIRVSADGYGTRTFSVELSGDHNFRGFKLPFLGDRPSMSGNYTLFFDVESCGAMNPSTPSLPVAFHHRSYDAVVTQSETRVDVKLSGSLRTNASGQGDNFEGTVIAGGARFFLGDFYPEESPYASVVERLPDGRYLVFGGQVTVRGTPVTGYSGSLPDGGEHGRFVTLWDTNFPASNTAMVASCFGGSATVKFVPR